MGGGESKVEFRETLAKLGDEDISIEDTAFWSKLWKTESTPHVRVFSSAYDSRVRDSPLVEMDTHCRTGAQLSSVRWWGFPADLFS